MKKITLLIVLWLIAFTMSSPTFAHSGRTDANGGHNDNKNASGLGSYHYHHGYSAHLHPDGVCPYDAVSSDTTTPIPPESPSSTEVQTPSLDELESSSPIIEEHSLSAETQAPFSTSEELPSETQKLVYTALMERIQRAINAPE